MLALNESLVFILISMLSLLVLAAGPAAVRLKLSDRVISACSIIMFLYLANTRALYDFFSFKLMLSAATVPFYHFFSSSHHFIISPEILSRYSLLLLILKQTLNLEHPFPATAR